MKFRTTIAQTGTTTTGIPVPDEVVEGLGGGRRPAVIVTVNGYTYRSWDRLSYSNRSWHVLQITGVKTDETRDRRVAKSIEGVREGGPR